MSMLRLTSRTAFSDRQLDGLIRTLVLILIAGVMAFVAIYAADRWRPPQPSLVDREIAALEQAVRDDATDIASRGRLADAYALGGRYADAIAQYDAILAPGTPVTQAHIGRGIANVALGQLDLAITDFEAVVELGRNGEMANVDPALQAAYYWLGSIALDQGRPTDAIDHLRQALHINRADADALNRIGAAYVATGETDKAISALRSAIAFVPSGWADPYETLSRAYTDAGEADFATRAAAMAALANGDAATAEVALGGLSGTPAAADADVGLGLIMELRGDAPAARARYRAALATDPDNRAAQMGLARVGADQGAASQLPALPPVHPAGERAP